MCASQAVRGRCTVPSLVALILVALAGFTSEAIAGTPRLNRPLGEVRGTALAQVSFDGRNWISLGSGALPVFDGTLIKARTGTFALTLLDGSRLEASPTTELAIVAMGSSTNVRMTEYRAPATRQPRSTIPQPCQRRAA